MTITASIVADSVSPQGVRLTTMQLRYPRFIHSEFMTHRVFSRNASSSRAIPVERLIQDVIDDPAMPVFWGSNKPGMQAGEELDNQKRVTTKALWLAGRDEVVDRARLLAKFGVHKQIVNRIIEPWCHINVVVTSTEWSNFYALRRHKDAQPEMKALADAMWDAHECSKPAELTPGLWHLPYVSGHNLTAVKGHDTAIKLSVARCARVSYFTHEGKPPTVEADLKLYDRLVGSVPLHASPAEHQATPDILELWAGVNDPWANTLPSTSWVHPRQHGNFIGWRQDPKMLPNESVGDR